MEWNEDDKKNLPQTISIIKQVEKTHKNLSLPLTFAKMCDLADLGLMVIAPRGKGKSAILQALCKQPLQHRHIIKLGAITYRGLKKVADRLDNNSVSIINHDISTLYTEYLRDTAINVFSQLLYDHEIPEMHTQQYDIQIKNAYISFLTGVQPQMYQSISRLPTFESMYKDRFIRLFMLYPFGTPTYKKTPPKIENIQIDRQIKTEYIEHDTTLEKMPLYKRLVELMKWHISEGRAEDFTERLIKASARLNNRTKTTESDVKFTALYIPYLAIEKWCAKRLRGVSNPLEFDPDAYTLLHYIMEKKVASRLEIRAEFQVTNTTVLNNIKPLMGKRIIKGKFGADQYTLHKQFINTYLQPIYNFMEQAVGITQEQPELTKWMVQ